MNQFKDNFSKQSDEYRRFRPTYPEELFVFLSTLTDEHQLVWDCGTGNGQAAIGLTKYYEHIHATDASQRQLGNAMKHDSIMYALEPAEKISLKDHTVDLVTVGLALHWFQFDLFYQEVRRVLKPKGVIAAWIYRLPTISEEVDTIVRHFHDEVVYDYWQPENHHVDNGYANVPFPFATVEPPKIEMRKTWNRADLVGLVRSWSAIQRIISTTGKNPIQDLERQLGEVWADDDQKEAVWELILKVGRV